MTYQNTTYCPNPCLACSPNAIFGDTQSVENEQKLRLDYYVFGSPMHGRSFSSKKYRFGFQNQESEDEIWGEGNASFFKYRISDNRVGRFFSVDPLAAEYPYNSTYAFSENKVIGHVELEGLESESYLEKIYSIYTTTIKLYDAAILLYDSYKTIDAVVNRTTFDVSVTANVNFTYSMGFRAALQVKDVAGFDIDLGSIKMIEVNGVYDFETGKFDGTFIYTGKGGKQIRTQQVSIAIPLEAIGIPVSIGGGYSKEEVEDIKGNVEESTETIKTGLGVGIFGVSLSGEEKVTADDTEFSTTAKGSAGAAGGLFHVVEGSVDINVQLKATVDGSSDDLR